MKHCGHCGHSLTNNANEDTDCTSEHCDRRRLLDDRDRLARENAELRADAVCLAEAMGEAVEMLLRPKKPHSNGEAAAVLLERTLSSRDSAKWLAEELEEARKETRLECLQVDDREALSELLALRQAQRDYPRRFSDIGLAEHDAKVRSESAVRIATLEAALSDALFAADHLGDELNDMDVAGEDPDLEKVSAAMNRARAALDGGKT